MTPNVTTISYPEFASEGNKTEPNQQKYLRGFLPEETFPAEWENWIENRTSRAVTALNSIADSVQKEIINVIAASGAEPDVENNSQLLTAIQYLINQAIQTQVVPQIQDYVSKTVADTITAVKTVDGANGGKILCTGANSLILSTTAGTENGALWIT